MMELMSWVTSSLARSLVCGRSVLGRPRIGATHVSSSAETYGMGVLVFMLGSYCVSHTQGVKKEAGVSGSIDFGGFETRRHTITQSHTHTHGRRPGELAAREATRIS